MSHTYKFDVKLFAAIAIEADSEEQAREKLAQIDGVEISLEVDGKTVTGEASLDDEEASNANLFKVDGEDV